MRPTKFLPVQAPKNSWEPSEAWESREKSWESLKIESLAGFGAGRPGRPWGSCRPSIPFIALEVLRLEALIGLGRGLGGLGRSWQLPLGTRSPDSTRGPSTHVYGRRRSRQFRAQGLGIFAFQEWTIKRKRKWKMETGII